MKALINRLHASALVRDTRGANMVEYIIVVGLVALIAIVGFSTFGGDVKQKIEDQSKKVKDVGSSATP
jgi:Flp pilus assembly pilin Flp